VISIGGLTVGGSGKTPVAMSVAARLRARGKWPAVVLRGYGGAQVGPLAVDAGRHTPADVGDEALLHAIHTPTWVARRRVAGANAAIAGGANVIVLDDGHQHPGIARDLSLVVVDGRTAFGNGRIVPAGPLREAVADGLARADAVVVVGEGAITVNRPVLRARLVPTDMSLRFRDAKVLGFAGIGRPGKFFATLGEIGASVVATRSFADHHTYVEDDVMRLVEEAARLGAEPVTTRKDWVRLPAAARPMISVVDVDLIFADEDAVGRRLAGLRHG
jgi:tetraacyldisaccharide 4'-kinase